GRAIREWLQPGGSERLPAAGRGLLAGNLVLWPTAAGLRALDVTTGQPVAEMPCNYTQNDIRGNLAATNGCLVVADMSHVHAYVAPRLLLEQRRRDAAQRPASPAARLELALAEADAGDHMAALQDFTQLAQSATPAEQWHGLPLAKLAFAESHEL